ncbi:hypothetical protein M0R72_16795 [Candidatus Pacearchaeota archaeon]|jgi:hypothetical protein|nr:hypothetical protein [Candidatus Pacearchaeota archaeon]
MRKIISKETDAKKQRRTQFIVGILLVLIMVLSTIGYSLNNQEDNSEKIIYNEFEFVKENNLWNTNVGNFQFVFLYNPTETEEIESDLNYLNEYDNLPLYIYSENSDAMMEIYRNLFYYNQIVERVQEACPEGEKCDEEIPIKNCTNNFIIIKKSEISEVRQEDNCVFISGKDEDLARITDGFLFKISGIQ